MRHARVAGVVGAHAVALLAALQLTQSVVVAAPPLPKVMLQVIAPQPMLPTPVEKPVEKPAPRPEPAAKPQQRDLPSPTPARPNETAPAPVVFAVASPAPSALAIQASEAPAATNAAPSPAPSAAAAPVAAAPPPPAPVVLPSTQADYLNNPAPPYPPIAKRLGESGRVVVRAFVGADGAVQRVELRTSSGFERLDQIAVDTVRAWRFKPGTRGGVAESMWVNVPIDFKLD
jgi:periplasmic protein TonB